MVTKSRHSHVIVCLKLSGEGTHELTAKELRNQGREELVGPKKGGNEMERWTVRQRWGKVGKIMDITRRLRKKEDNQASLKKNETDSREIEEV